MHSKIKCLPCPTLQKLAGVLIKIHNNKTLLLIIISIFEEFEYFKLYSCVQIMVFFSPFNFLI
jgi:hypothetical protein